MRLFLDANVLFTAAHNPGGRSAAICQLARAGLCTLVTSPHALEEARRNVRLKHPSAVDALEELVAVTSVDPHAIPLSDDGGQHQLRVVLGEPAAAVAHS